MSLKLNRAEWADVLRTAQAVAHEDEIDLQESPGMERVRLETGGRPGAGFKARLSREAKEARIADHVHVHIVALKLLRVLKDCREEAGVAPPDIRAAITPLLGGIELDTLGRL